jgi:hypothetical protein
VKNSSASESLRLLLFPQDTRRKKGGGRDGVVGTTGAEDETTGMGRMGMLGGDAARGGSAGTT